MESLHLARNVNNCNTFLRFYFHTKEFHNVRVIKFCHESCLPLEVCLHVCGGFFFEHLHCHHCERFMGK